VGITRKGHPLPRRRRQDHAERAARRAELLDAADRVIREAGPDASMTAIAAEAGITKPILYRHFGDKGGLYRALAERYIDPLLTDVREAMAGAQAAEQVPSTIDAYLAFIEANPQVYRFLMHRAQNEQPEAATAVSATIRRLGDEVGSALRYARGLSGPAAIAADALGHGIVGMVHVAGDWWLDNPRMTREELTVQLSGLVLDGLNRHDPSAPAYGIVQPPSTGRVTPVT
jgi:AcrR family transcriptional regulator